ncbi:hypothetical protein [Paenibacillus solani]|uniref:Uncharacterized protein n=1 Tax=Paenibacillus solani TaxID=1705565 RepID=A0A0M1N4I2_9BACL|nr:hypothetical protein [Paenibacillus solani]KOR76864.1 hypothetical protein AM231_23320 [Paenibacillus solani]
MNTGISGLDGLDEKRLSDIRDNASKLSDMKQEVPVDELFPESFIQKHTRFSSINHLLLAAGYEGSTDEEFDEFIQGNTINPFIVEHTPFRSWQDFQELAVSAYITKWIGF